MALLVSAVTKRLPYAGSAFTRVIEGCFLATLLFSKGSSCLVLNDFWSRDILAVLASAAGGVQVLLGCSFTAQLGSVSMQPQRARQPLFDAWSRLEAPDTADDGVQLLLRPALRAKAVPELGLSRATRYMSAVPLAAQAFCVCPVIVTDRLRAPPQACRKIHDCDAAAESRGGREPGAPTTGS